MNIRVSNLVIMVPWSDDSQSMVVPLCILSCQIVEICKSPVVGNNHNLIIPQFHWYGMLQHGVSFTRFVESWRNLIVDNDCSPQSKLH